MPPYLNVYERVQIKILRIGVPFHQNLQIRPIISPAHGSTDSPDFVFGFPPKLATACLGSRFRVEFTGQNPAGKCPGWSSCVQ